MVNGQHGTNVPSIILSIATFCLKKIDKSSQTWNFRVSLKILDWFFFRQGGRLTFLFQSNQVFSFLAKKILIQTLFSTMECLLHEMTCNSQTDYGQFQARFNEVEGE